MSTVRDRHLIQSMSPAKNKTTTAPLHPNPTNSKHTHRSTHLDQRHLKLVPVRLGEARGEGRPAVVHHNCLPEPLVRQRVGPVEPGCVFVFVFVFVLCVCIVVAIRVSLWGTQ